MGNINVTPWPHYYGDIVRKLFFAAAVIMFVSLPFLNTQLPIALSMSVLVIVIIGLFAGLTSPVKPFTIFTDMVVSVIAALVFEYYSVITFQSNSATSLLFWAYMVLGLIFLVALYYSTKSVRAMMLERRHA